ncbi:hypothetical protein Poli38472_007874 [Pythium oligandrum]|uniref:Uncharacterized protein n=1 Tax=Pythium oligandrum TaxID=41045 RepID=A0A8K1CSZ9_PYTOL|nr:hypothetical protein Poli38472_007874 [Pythium oligandrum]|eukprot:TMW68202.1 hypothetical protein Poli38472_007874 [Pythium oligandrum]
MSISLDSDSSGFSYVWFNNSDCSDISVGNNFMFPRDFNTSADGKMIPSVIIDNASIVVNITNTVNAKSTNFTISQCDTTSVTFNTGFLTAITPTVGKLIVIQGQCV